MKGRGFTCKQFVIAQDRCAMKVSTDGLILGSWAEASEAKRILDIGTGTGLLSLMISQKSLPDANVTALEIDVQAVEQARKNVAHSPWPEKVEVLHIDFNHYTDPVGFDLIVSNPPFYSAAASPTRAYTKQQDNRKKARQDAGLNPGMLFKGIGQLLDAGGYFYCIYPFERSDDIVATANAHKLYLQETLAIRATPAKSCYLCAFKFGFNKVEPTKTHLTIRDKNNDYTSAYRQLCQPYYLAF